MITFSRIRKHCLDVQDEELDKQKCELGEQGMEMMKMEEDEVEVKWSTQSGQTPHFWVKLSSHYHKDS